MTNEDKNEFAEIINDLCDMYGKKPSKGMYRMYFSAMIDFRIAEIQDAVSSHLADIESGQYFPKPADLIRHLSKGKTSLEIKNEQARVRWLEKKKVEISIGQSAYTQEEITRIEMGV